MTEIRAGYADGVRTRKPRPSDLRVGGPNYHIGFLAGAALRAVVRLALKGARA